MDSISRSKFAEGRWVSLRTVMLIRMLFGFYCNINCNKIMACLARFYCICLGTVATTIFIFGYLKYELDVLLFFPLCFEYNINALVSIFTGDNHLINFYREIEQIDRQIGLEHQPFMTLRCEALFLFFCGYKNALHFLIFCFVVQKYYFYFACYVMSTAIIIGNISRCFPLELLRLRVKHLWCDLEMDLKRGNRRENINQINSVKESMKLYRHLMDKLMVMSWEKLLICVSFLTTFIFVLTNSRNGILSLKDENFENAYIINVAAVDALVAITLICLPPILCEMVAKEVDKLKIVIGNALLVCDDDDLHAELLGAAEYLALRPFSATVCRAFALDAPLVLTFISLCTTYTIVLIQYYNIL